MNAGGAELGLETATARVVADVRSSPWWAISVYWVAASVRTCRAVTIFRCVGLAR
jgi:hypothetical protein